MEDLTGIMMSDYKPEAAIVVYKATDNIAGYQQEYYIERHGINEKGQLLEGVPLTQAMIMDIVDTFYEKRGETGISGVLPASVLHYKWQSDKKQLMWYNPPMSRMMYFTKAVKIKDGERNQPGLIYALLNGRLQIYATKCTGRPDEDTELFVAPYHNCSPNDGQVCMGSAKVKTKGQKFQDIISKWELMFWGSEFSHLAGNNSMIEGNLNVMWQQAEPGIPFNTEVLKPTGMTLGKLLNRLAR